MSQELNDGGNSGAEQKPKPPYSQPASTYNPQPAPGATSGAQRPRGNNSSWIFLGVIAALAGICIYLYFSRKNVIQQNVTVSGQRDSVVVAHDNLNTEYQAAITRLDQLNTNNAQLTNEIKDKDGELQKMRTELAGIMSKEKRSESDNSRAKALIVKLNAKVQSYEARITALEGQNKQLTTENSDLSQQKEQLNGENTNLQQKVKLGAVLHANNIRLEAIKLKRGGKKEVETTKARKTDLLRIIFDIDENRIAESGTKEIMLRITAPDGRLLSNAAYGSGVTTTDDGQQLPYTLSKQIALTQNTPVKDVTVDWNQDSDYERGTYAIDLYNGGFRIGGGSVTLR